MAFTNYSFTTLRASSATTAGVTSGQDAAVTLPEPVHDFWAIYTKTAEAAADNLMTLRLQCKIGANWYDLPRSLLLVTNALSVIGTGDTAVSRAPNIRQESTAATETVLQYYDSVPSNVVRVAWIASSAGAPGGVSHTFSVIAAHMLNDL